MRQGQTSRGWRALANACACEVDGQGRACTQSMCTVGLHWGGAHVAEADDALGVALVHARPHRARHIGAHRRGR